MMSAAERQVVGCPLPALLVEATESIRSCVAMSRSAATEVAAISDLVPPWCEHAGRRKRAVYHSAAAIIASASSAAGGPAPAARPRIAASVRAAVSFSGARSQVRAIRHRTRAARAVGGKRFQRLAHEPDVADRIRDAVEETAAGLVPHRPEGVKDELFGQHAIRRRRQSPRRRRARASAIAIWSASKPRTRGTRSW